MVRVAVLGCGILGSKMISDLAYHGHEVRAYDTNQEELDKLVVRLAEDTRILRQDCLLDQENLASNVLCMSSLEEAVCDADFVFEAIVEDLPTKKRVIEQVSHLCPTTAIIGSSSMHLNIDSIFERAAGQDRCLGVRFLFPVLEVSEVEIQKTKRTSSQCMTIVHQFLEGMGKIAFLRSGNLPLVLNRQQREYRWLSRTSSSQAQTVRRTPSLPTPSQLRLRESDGQNFELSSNRKSKSREKDCVICMDEERNCVVQPCNHLSMCTTCAERLLEQNNECPICRTEILAIFKIFNA